MNILILGSGGREHAITKKISESTKVSHLYAAPGNPGTAEIAINVDLKLNDFEGIAQFCFENEINYVIVGPEAPLVEGLTDFLNSDERTSNITVIGPNKKAAQLEGSKDFAKQFMMRHHIPTAQYRSFTKEKLNDAKAFLKELNAPYVLKADGLAAGKGVVILDDIKEAEKELEIMLDGKFGAASTTVVIEEFLKGIEVSFFVLTDGNDYVVLPEAKDYKRIGEGDTGLNTGGMGAVSPVPFAEGEFRTKVLEKVIQPTIEGLQKDNIKFQGFIFFGLIKVGNEPFVIEYNVRMGDPETEVVMPRIKSDFTELLEGIKEGNLSERNLEITPETAATVMLVSQGYPQAYEKGKEIKIVGKINSIIYHAGTRQEQNKVVTNGGRVMAITSLSDTIQHALDKSYESVSYIDFEGKNYRGDIGFDL